MKSKQAIFLSLSLTLCLVVLIALLTPTGNPTHARSSILYVDSGSRCGEFSPCYGTIQAAVDDASNGDTVRIAEEQYTAAGLQVIYFSKAIALTEGCARTAAEYITVYETVVADFSASPISGPVPLTVNLANLSVGDYDACTWTFGSGRGVTGSL